MTTTVDRQCRVVTVAETAADDACTVAAVRELAWGMNNYKACVSGQHLVSSVSPTVGTGTLWGIQGGTSGERLVHKFAPRILPWGYTEIWFQISGFYIPGIAAKTCSWRLYASTRPYSGGLAFDSSQLGPVWDVSTAIVMSAIAPGESPAGVQDLEAVRNESGLVHLTLTAEWESGATDGDYSFLRSVLAVARGAGL